MALTSSTRKGNSLNFEMEKREAYILLNLIDGLGPIKVRSLIDILGSPKAIFEAAVKDLEKVPGIGKKLARRIADGPQMFSVEEELEKVYQLGAQIVTPLDATYPARLKTIHNPPLALYVWGTLEKEDQHSLAIVGSRQATHYGLMTADRLSYQLAQTGFSIISGLARGIDTAAHRGTLKSKGRTIAVLGSALDTLYPPENQELASQISKSGAVISEYPLGMKASRRTFPYRNRIISGISAGTLVIETGRNGGSMHTADAAMEQGRSVFAVPGRIDSPNARGTNYLIKNGACLVDNLDDILNEFEFLIPKDALEKPPKERSSKAKISLNDEESKLLKVLWGNTMDIDSLARECNLASAEVSALLIGLEMKRVVNMLPGRMVELVSDLYEE